MKKLRIWAAWKLAILANKIDPREEVVQTVKFPLPGGDYAALSVIADPYGHGITFTRKVIHEDDASVGVSTFPEGDRSGWPVLKEFDDWEAEERWLETDDLCPGCGYSQSEGVHGYNGVYGGCV